MAIAFTCPSCNTYEFRIPMLLDHNRLKFLCENCKNTFITTDRDHVPSSEGAIRPHYKNTEVQNILQEADKLTANDRREEYGNPKTNFSDIAAIWTVLLDAKVTAQQVVSCMVALKLCRAKKGYKRDTWVDVAGYARCAELVEE